MKLLAVIGLVAGLCFLASTRTAEAHPLPKGVSVKYGLHVICKTLSSCADPAPKPKGLCRWSNRGRREDIYDPKLGGIVTWECACPWGQYGNCLWRRVSIRPANSFDAVGARIRQVRDWQRKCPQIMCERVLVYHNYRTLRYYPGRR